MFDYFREPKTPEEKKHREEMEAARLRRIQILKERSDEQLIQEAFKRDEEQLRKEREERSAPKDVKLTNPRWEHVDEIARSERPDQAFIGETIKLFVDQEHGNGKSITFNIHDIKINSRIDPNREVHDIKGKIDSPTPSTEWTVTDPRSRKEKDREMQVYFYARSGKDYSENCYITLLDHPKSLKLLEIEDCLFRHNSALFLPDSINREEESKEEQEPVTGLAVLKAILKHAHTNCDKKLLIAGHTDRSGPAEYNFQLSHARAEGITALLIKDCDTWVNIATEHHLDEDIQHLLKWICTTKGWDCNPGEIDGVLGDKSKGAIKTFQEKTGLTADGIVGPKSFTAVYDLIQEAFTALMSSEEDLKILSSRNSLNWAYDCRAVGCGEYFPITEEMKSQTDRRVEVLFFDEKELPHCACKEGICHRGECVIYRDGFFDREYLEVGIENVLICIDETGSILTDLNYYIMKDGEKVASGHTDTNGLIQYNKELKGGQLFFDFESFKKTKTDHIYSRDSLNIKQKIMMGKAEFSEGVELDKGEFEIVFPVLVMNLEPGSSDKNQYRLFNETDSFSQTLNSDDDQDFTNNFLDLHFVGIQPDKEYTLVFENSNNEPINIIFQDQILVKGAQ